MAGKGRLLWTPDKLDAWLKKPKDVVAGTTMTLAGLTAGPRSTTSLLTS